MASRRLIVSAPRGKIDGDYTLQVVGTRHWRAFFDIAADGPDPVDIRAYLRLADKARVLADPEEAEDAPGDCGGDRGYRGRAYLSVPICYGAPHSPLRCIGVINLTDRIGGDRFTPGDRKLVTAVANQIGAAVENSRLVERDLRQQQLRRELQLAHDLQLKLLPAPGVLHGDAEVAVRCFPAESVGGDFYTFTRLGRGRVGVQRLFVGAGRAAPVIRAWSFQLRRVLTAWAGKAYSHGRVPSFHR